MTTKGLSVITVCMNRQHHVQATAVRVAESAHHQEHLVLDWSSREPLRRDQLPNDSRIRLERVEGESRWNLCRAYNLAAKLAHGDVLLKLDADCWPEHIDTALHLKTVSDVCWFGSGSDGRLGQFLMSRAAYEAVGGFNELLVGYGFDDKDLKARLQSLGFVISMTAPEKKACARPTHRGGGRQWARCATTDKRHATGTYPVAGHGGDAAQKTLRGTEVGRGA